MSKVILVIIAAIALYSWFRSRRNADRVLAKMTADREGTSGVEQAEGASERSAELGLLPGERQNTRYAAPLEPACEKALEAVRAGDWAPAAELLATTTANGDWERRALYVELLGAQVRADADAAGGLTAWERDRAGDGDAALVRAAASDPGEARTAALTRAREHAPNDPTPYVVELAGAVAAALPHADATRLWERAVARAPYLYAAHAVALRYWFPAPKGRGSDPLAEEFARLSAADAPLGSLMTTFPLLDWFETHLDTSRDPEEFRTAELTERVDRALMDAAAAPADHPRLPELRHLLAYFLYKQHRYESALEQFRLVDGHVNAVPWNYYREQNLYMRARDTTVRKAG